MSQQLSCGTSLGKIKCKSASLEPLDYQKSTFKKCNLVKGKTPKESKSESKSKIFLLVHNGNDEIIESYVSDNEVLSEIHEVLKELSEQLSGLHFGLKFDLIR